MQEEVQTTQAETVPSVDKWYTPLTRVTPLSKYFAMALFVVLPFVGFWTGVEWGMRTHDLSRQKSHVSFEAPRNIASTVSENNISPTSSTAESIDAVLLRISGNFESTFLEPEDYSFEWYWYEGGEATPTVSVIEGRMIRVTDYSFQDKDEEYGSSVYRLDASVIEYITSHQHFDESLANDADGPHGSILGFENAQQHVVCQRRIEATDSEFLVYLVACGLHDDFLGKDGALFSVGSQLVATATVKEVIADAGGVNPDEQYIPPPEVVMIAYPSPTNEYTMIRLTNTGCVDENIVSGDKVLVSGMIVKNVPDYALILKCESGAQVSLMQE